MNETTSHTEKILAGLTLAYGMINGVIPLLIILMRWGTDAPVSSPTLFGVLVLIFSLGIAHAAAGVGMLTSNDSLSKLGEACLFFSLPLALVTSGLLWISGVQPGTFAAFGLVWSAWVVGTGLVWAVAYKVVSSRFEGANPSGTRRDTVSADEQS